MSHPELRTTPRLWQRLLSWLEAVCAEGHDPAWRPTGIDLRRLNALGYSYDQRKALDGARRARERTATGRPYEPLSTPENVASMRRRRHSA